MAKKQIIFIICIMIMTATIGAEVPQVINYQGRLTDAVGDPVADGAHLVKFTIYDDVVGGTTLWSSGFQNVSTISGLFNYELGSNVALPDDMFTDTLSYLGITVGVDAELSPRSRLETVPYAFHALRADTALFTESSIGVTQKFDDGDVVLTGYLNLTITDSINCPTSGYVMLNTTLTMNCSHTSGDDDVIFVLLTDSTYTVTSDQDNSAWTISTGSSTNFYSTIIQKHKIFAVDAGWNEFNVISSQNPGGGTDNCVTGDVVMTLMFIPQSLGTVASSEAAPPNPNFDKAIK